MTDQGRAKLKIHEGEKLRPYMDCCGRFWRECACSRRGNLTIGIGHNLEYGISRDASDFIFEQDLSVAVAECRREFLWFDRLDAVRQDVIINLAFNMGIERLKGFRRMLDAAEHDDWETAAYELFNSLWAKQVQKPRRDDLVNALANGEWS